MNMNRRIAACAICMALLLFVMDQREYPLFDSCLMILLPMLIGLTLAWILVFSKKKRLSREELYDEYCGWLNYQEALLIFFVAIDVSKGDLLSVLFDLSLIFGFLFAFPISFPGVDPKFRRNIRKLERLNRKQRQYIVRHVAQILKRPVDAEIYSGLEAFFSQRQMWKNRNQHPEIDALILEFAEKACEFWEEHERVKFFLSKIPNIRNSEERSHEKTVVQSDIKHFETKWNVKMLE